MGMRPGACRGGGCDGALLGMDGLTGAPASSGCFVGLCMPIAACCCCWRGGGGGNGGGGGASRCIARSCCCCWYAEVLGRPGAGAGGGGPRALASTAARPAAFTGANRLPAPSRSWRPPPARLMGDRSLSRDRDRERLSLSAGDGDGLRACPGRFRRTINAASMSSSSSLSPRRCARPPLSRRRKPPPLRLSPLRLSLPRRGLRRWW